MRLLIREKTFGWFGMKKGEIISILLLIGICSLIRGIPAAVAAVPQEGIKLEEQRVLDWRKERDAFFRNHPRSPLLPHDRRSFKGLKYYPFNPQYVFSGKIERFIFNINNPRYYATFLTNKGTNKRYLSYGQFRFTLEGKEYVIEIYKSILSDYLFIPFKDKTNGKETYEGGRYLDAEVLPDYQMLLDFNMAYNPTCAYNEKFVCVLPPRENMLPIEIRTGEKKFK